MPIYMGIDIGSAFSKGVLISREQIIESVVFPSGANYRQTTETIYEQLLGDKKKEAITFITATGSGAKSVRFCNKRVGDMLCTAKGIHFYSPAVRTVINVASQSSKILRIDKDGNIMNFSISEKCAIGAGRFIEIVANVLRIKLEEFGTLSLKSRNPVSFSTSCAVFGESEAITRIAEGVLKEDIAAGVNKSLATKISTLVRRVVLEEPCAICGGGALNRGLVQAIENMLGIELIVPEQPQFITALGAAIINGY